ncbi:hypothetical protein HispidOSU_017583 [Sigmodon hispidus]
MRLDDYRLTQHPNGALWAASVEKSQCPSSPNRAKSPGLSTTLHSLEENLHLLNDTKSTFEFLPRIFVMSSNRDGTAEAPAARRSQTTNGIPHRSAVTAFLSKSPAPYTRHVQRHPRKLRLGLCFPP